MTRQSAAVSYKAEGQAEGATVFTQAGNTAERAAVFVQGGRRGRKRSGFLRRRKPPHKEDCAAALPVSCNNQNPVCQ